MKNKGFLIKCIIIVAVVLILGVIAGVLLHKQTFGVYQKIDFMNDEPNLFAKRMLWLYTISEINQHSKVENNFREPTVDDVKAYLVDLNDDGRNEIVGVVYSSHWWGTGGYSLFILEYRNEMYVNIGYLVNFEPQKDFYILNSKTDGYRKIKLHGSTAYNFKPLIVEYDKNHYKSDEQIRKLEEYMIKFSGYDVSEITGIKENFTNK